MRTQNSLNGNEIIGYNRVAMRGVTVFTESPSGGATDALQFLMTFDTEEQCDRVTAVLEEMWNSHIAILREGYPVR